jgi:hypothetical protein
MEETCQVKILEKGLKYAFPMRGANNSWRQHDLPKLPGLFHQTMGFGGLGEGHDAVSYFKTSNPPC